MLYLHKNIKKVHCSEHAHKTQSAYSNAGVMLAVPEAFRNACQTDPTFKLFNSGHSESSHSAPLCGTEKENSKAKLGKGRHRLHKQAEPDMGNKSMVIAALGFVMA